MKKAVSGNRLLKMISIAVCLAVALIMCLAVNAGSFGASAAKTGWTGPVFETEFESEQEALDAVHEHNLRITEEGYVLLKNEDVTYTTSGWRPTTETVPSLPLAASRNKISVFGKNSVNPVYSGSGSSGGSGVDVTLIDSLKNEGFEVNPKLVNFYNDKDASGSGRSSASMSNAQASYWNVGETPQSMYPDEVKNSYADYNNAAVVVISRIGGEGADLPMSSFATTKGQTAADANANPGRDAIEDEIEGNGTWTPVGGSGRESNPFEHYLELDDNEKALIQSIKDSGEFSNIIIVLNSLSAFEVKPLAEDEAISSIIWAPGAGQNGFESLAKIISGKVNPSGKTVDALVSDFTKTPSFANQSGHRIGNGLTTTSDLGNQYYREDENGLLVPFDGFLPDYETGGEYGYDTGHGYFGVEYEEGIYVGYQYYETAAAEAAAGNYAGFDYDEEVVYPFGYGLSYTTFEWTVGDLEVGTADEYGNFTVSLDVTVKNTGEVAGKDVVQLYYEAPYVKGEVEKSKVVLGDFAKTKLLEKGETDTVTLTLEAFDMASFDVYDANDNDKNTWELDAGNYYFYVTTDSHGWATATDANKKTHNLASEVVFDKDPHSGKDVGIRFETMNEEMKDGVMSREDFAGTFPQSAYWFDVTADNTVLDPFWSAQYRYIYGKNYSAADWSDGKTVTPVNAVPDDWSSAPKYLKKADAETVKTDDWLANLLMPFEYDEDGTVDTENNPAFRDTYDSVDGADKWYYTEAGTEEGAKKATYSFRDSDEAYTTPGSAPIQLKTLVGKAMDDPAWDDFVSQMTVEQAAASINGKFTQFGVAEANATAFGIVSSIHHDGPQGISNAWGAPGKAELSNGGEIKGNFAPETVVASTWNEELAHRQGDLTGQVALWNHSTGWYAPGVNMHRSQFGGRNFEYYSEDATLSGKMAAAVVTGAGEHGLICYMKHFALNDMETARENNNMSVWADEQTVRQIYLRPFERAAKAVNDIRNDAGVATPAAFMTSFNRFGFEWAGACYDLMTGLVREEWGIIGQFTTDAFQSKNGGMNANMMIRAGGDIGLDLRAQNGLDFATVFGQPKAGADGTKTPFCPAELTPSHLQAIYDCVKRQAYCLLNSNATMNGFAFDFLDSSDDTTKNRGYNLSAYDVDGATFTAMKGIPVSFDVSDSDLGDIQYRMQLGDMPEGLSLNPQTGKIEGTVDASVKGGTYTVKVCVTAEGASDADKWVIFKNANNKISQFTIKVVEPSAYDVADMILDIIDKIQKDPEADVSSDIAILKAALDAISESSGDMSVEGIKDRLDALEEALESLGGSAGPAGPQGPAGEDGEDGVTPSIEIGENGNWIINGVDTGVSATGPAGPQGEKGDKGETGAPGADGSSGGCGSNIAGTLVLVGIALAGLVVAAIVMRKLRRN